MHVLFNKSARGFKFAGLLFAGLLFVHFSLRLSFRLNKKYQSLDLFTSLHQSNSTSIPVSTHISMG